jgi:expansin (peptidoglycan-binding protein)
VRPPIRSCFDAILPPHRTYLSLSRKRFLLVLLAITLALLALILGLSIGLTRKSGGSPASLPLPTSSGIHTGELTYYAPGLGACGWTSGDGDAIVAVSHEVFDAAGGGNPNPNANPLCGKMIRVERDRGGGRGNKSVDVVVVDRCVGCKPTDLDLSPSTFAELADMDLGRVVGSWAWL